jgi:DNA-binding transcriptional regulator YiaG
MLPEVTRMTPQELRDHLARLEISQQAFARLIRVNPSTVRRWLMSDTEQAQDIPRYIEILMPLLTPAHVKKLIAADNKAA